MMSEQVEPKKRKNRKLGRPLKIDNDILSKLDYAFSIGCNVSESCCYADISLSCFYKYLDRNPEYKAKIDLMRKKPVLKAKQGLYNQLVEEDPVMIRWYLEHKASDEFNTRSEVSVNTTGSLSIESRSEALDGFLRQFKG